MSISVCLSRFVFRFWICVQMLSLKPYLMDYLFATIVSILQVILRCFIRLGLKRCNFSIVKLLLNLFSNILNEKSPKTLLKTFFTKNNYMIFYCCILTLLAKKNLQFGNDWIFLRFTIKFFILSHHLSILFFIPFLPLIQPFSFLFQPYPLIPPILHLKYSIPFPHSNFSPHPTHSLFHFILPTSHPFPLKLPIRLFIPSVPLIPP